VRAAAVASRPLVLGPLWATSYGLRYLSVIRRARPRVEMRTEIPRPPSTSIDLPVQPQPQAVTSLSCALVDTLVEIPHTNKQSWRYGNDLAARGRPTGCPADQLLGGGHRAPAMSRPRDGSRTHAEAYHNQAASDSRQGRLSQFNPVAPTAAGPRLSGYDGFGDNRTWLRELE
jgi:hypothetical protein